MPELDLAKALEARDHGITKVASHNQTFLETARGIARMLCRQKGRITADDVREECAKRGIAPDHYNGWGGVFHKSEFECVGFTRSRQVQGHGNMIRVWRLKDANNG
jgi:hypothetical protein